MAARALSFTGNGKGCLWKMACRAEARTRLGKAERGAAN